VSGKLSQGNNDWAEAAENGRIGLGIHAASRNEPGFKNDGLGMHWLPVAVHKKIGSLGEGACR